MRPRAPSDRRRAPHVATGGAAHHDPSAGPLASSATIIPRLPGWRTMRYGPVITTRPAPGRSAAARPTRRSGWSPSRSPVASLITTPYSCSEAYSEGRHNIEGGSRSVPVRFHRAPARSGLLPGTAATHRFALLRTVRPGRTGVTTFVGTSNIEAATILHARMGSRVAVPSDVRVWADARPGARSDRPAFSPA